MYSVRSRVALSRYHRHYARRCGISFRVSDLMRWGWTESWTLVSPSISRRNPSFTTIWHCDPHGSATRLYAFPSFIPRQIIPEQDIFEFRSKRFSNPICGAGVTSLARTVQIIVLASLWRMYFANQPTTIIFIIFSSTWSVEKVQLLILVSVFLE